MNDIVYSQSEEQVSESAFFRNVYAWMSAGLGITGLTALYTFTNPYLFSLIFSSSIGFYGLIIGQLLLVMAFSGLISRVSFGAGLLMYLAYSMLNGLTLSAIFLIYSLGSIATTFLITTATFGIMSLIGYITKKDLTGFGRLLMMGLIGIIIASVVNMFVANSMLDWIITYVGIFIFIGLIAYDTQKLKNLHREGFVTGEAGSKIALVGALTLYLDFINLFLLLLRLFGSRK